MKCPNDGSTLVMSERSGVEIDYCPDCRGVWLDRGELDKILDRAASESPAAAGPAATPAPSYAEPRFPQQQYRDPRYDERDGRGGYDHRYGENGGYKKKRKDSWLSELFD